MYKPGQVKWDSVIDSTTENYDDVEGAYLPHSCNNWVIGGREQIKTLIADLELLLKEHL